jgi:hypothetical protein
VLVGTCSCHGCLRISRSTPHLMLSRKVLGSHRVCLALVVHQQWQRSMPRVQVQ